MLASTIRFSNHYQTPPHTRQQYCQQRVGLGPVEPHVVIPGPNSVPVLPRPHPHTSSRHEPDHPVWMSEECDVPPLSNPPEPRTGSVGGHHTGVLLRKEVIQPHLPVRLPCYDLVPITSPTLDGPLQKTG